MVGFANGKIEKIDMASFEIRTTWTIAQNEKIGMIALYDDQVAVSLPQKNLVSLLKYSIWSVEKVHWLKWCYLDCNQMEHAVTCSNYNWIKRVINFFGVRIFSHWVALFVLDLDNSQLCLSSRLLCAQFGKTVFVWDNKGAEHLVSVTGDIFGVRDNRLVVCDLGRTLVICFEEKNGKVRNEK